MPLSSNSLFHYTKGGMDAICGILENGFRVAYNKEYHIHTVAKGSVDYNNEALNNSEYYQSAPHYGERHYLHIPMVSFCDIPINLINRHLEKYGTPSPTVYDPRQKIGYAIGMSKNWAIRNKLHPLMYIIPGSELAKTLDAGIDRDILLSLKVTDPENSYNQHEKYMEPTPMNRETNLLIDNKGNIFPKIALYSKLLGFRHHVFGEEGDKFMDEREWRFVPMDAKIIHEHEYAESGNTVRNYFFSVRSNAEKALESAKVKGYPNLEFNIDDITHIIVGLDSEISKTVDHLYSIYKKTCCNRNINVFLVL